MVVRRPERVAIVGGGFTGAEVARHLAAALAGGPPIEIVEPRTELGCGLAYATREPAHRINVPAARMSLSREDPEHFARWLAASGELERDPAAVWPASGAAFPQRNVFGRYVAERLRPLLETGRIRHRCERAVRASFGADGQWRLGLQSGGSLDCDVLVLATTHPPPGTPAELLPIAREPGYVADPYHPQALEGIAEDACVLVIGSGLASADVVAALDRRGHRGSIRALSRNGLRSRGHAPRRGEWSAGFVGAAAAGARPLVRAIRTEVSRAQTAGAPWQWVLDVVRDEGADIWSALPRAEQARLVRRLRTFWDVHRFRIAPQVEAVLDRRAAAGQFATLAARLVASEPRDGQLAVGFRPRGSPEVERVLFDHVVNTTGPSHGGVLSGRGFLRSLGDAGHLRMDRVGLGLDADRRGRAIGVDGRARPTLFVAGPLARGTFGELMGLPEVARYAAFVAARVAEEIAARPLAASA